MASADELARLRRLVNMPTETAPYTDELLESYIDELGIEVAAAQIWREVAASYAGLVDVTESGSSRKLSSMYTNALGMANGVEGEAPRATYIEDITRD